MSTLPRLTLMSKQFSSNPPSGCPLFQTKSGTGARLEVQYHRPSLPQSVPEVHQSREKAEFPMKSVISLTMQSNCCSVSISRREELRWKQNSFAASQEWVCWLLHRRQPNLKSAQIKKAPEKAKLNPKNPASFHSLSGQPAASFAPKLGLMKREEEMSRMENRSILCC